jgi:hypothetical protein
MKLRFGQFSYEFFHTAKLAILGIWEIKFKGLAIPDLILGVMDKYLSLTKVCINFKDCIYAGI